jgi:hypothetical protein
MTDTLINDFLAEIGILNAEIERLNAEIARQREVIETWREAHIDATGADQ